MEKGIFMTTKRQRIRKRVEKARKRKLSIIQEVPLFEEDFVEETPVEFLPELDAEIEEHVEHTPEKGDKEEEPRSYRKTKSRKTQQEKQEELEEEVV